MSELIKIRKVNEVYFQISYDDYGTALELKEFFSCYISNYKFHPKVKAKVWDGKVSFYNRNNDTLPIGLLPKLIKFCKKYSYEYKFEFDPKTMFNDIKLEEVEKYCNELTKELDFNHYDYQIDAIHKALQNKRGVLLSATGSGKSIIQYAIVRKILGEGKRTLIIVPNVSLVEQLYSNFKYDYKWHEIADYVTKMHADAKPDLSLPILISTWQSLQTKPLEFFVDYDSLMVDETHGAKGMAIKTICEKCVHCEYRIGLTGTLPKDESDVNTIFGYLGPVIFKQGAKELIDRGVLSNLNIMNVMLKYPQDIITKYKYRPYNEELDLTINYPDRNKSFDFIFEHIKKGQNTLILCNFIEHLERIEEYLLDNLSDEYEVCIIHGNIKASERESIRQMMEHGENIVLVSTFGTMSTGVNVKRIHHVVFASSSKSPIRTLQSIGRGLRLHESKDKLVLWDIVDDLTFKTRTGNIGKNHLYKHYEERLRIYDDQGFKHYSTKLSL